MSRLVVTVFHVLTYNVSAECFGNTNMFPADRTAVLTLAEKKLKVNIQE